MNNEVEINEEHLEENSEIKINIQVFVDGEIKQEEECERMMGLYIKDDENDEDLITINLFSAGGFTIQEIVKMKDTIEIGFQRHIEGILSKMREELTPEEMFVELMEMGKELNE